MCLIFVVIFLGRKAINLVNLLMLSKSEGRHKIIVTVDLRAMSVKGISDTWDDRTHMCNNDDGMLFYFCSCSI